MFCLRGWSSSLSEHQLGGLLEKVPRLGEGVFCVLGTDSGLRTGSVDISGVKVLGGEPQLSVPG